jgi:metallo-beta-lactamase class B
VKHRRSLILVAWSIGGCASMSSGLRVESLGPDLQMLRVTDRLWIHVTDDKTERWGTVPANGMLVLGEKSSVLIDTGWNIGQTKRIADFAAKELDRPIGQVIVTHAHSDRIGGIRALTSSNMLVHAQELTSPLIAALDPTFTVEPWTETKTLQVGEHTVELYYPGPGHSKDNAVVYLAEAKILFAGCLVKSGKSADLGNREAAILAAWPVSLLKLLERYPDAELVIPGHGPPGGLNLIHHTLGLLEQELSTVTPN